VNRELLKDDTLDQQLDGVTVRSDEDRLNEVCCHWHSAAAAASYSGWDDDTYRHLYLLVHTDSASHGPGGLAPRNVT